MGDLGGLFTGRKVAVSALRALAEGKDRTRVLVLTGVSGMGKSTVLSHVQAHPPPGWTCAVIDAEALVSGMVVRSEGAEEAALLLLRQIGGHLATLGPWWSRRWLRQRAASIGRMRPLPVRIRQWAGFGGSISNSPVHVTVGAPTQGQRRGQWTDELLTVARRVRRGRLVLMVDSCERLAYFDDVRAEQPRSGHPYGVAGWFSGVVDQLLEAAPNLRVVLAGTTTVAGYAADGGVSDRVACLELQPWKPGDTRRYLTRRGLKIDPTVAAAVTDTEGGLPATISWIADALNGLLTDEPTGSPSGGDVLAHLAELTGPARTQWLRGHVLDRLSEGTLHLLRVAAVLNVFTPTTLVTIAQQHRPVDSGAFARLTQTSCISPHSTGDDFRPVGHWRMHTVMNRWLLDDARAHDAQQQPSQQILPALHRAAADHHEALAGDAAWSLEAARHRFATGDDTHAHAWTDRLTTALRATPLDTLQIQLLTDAALSAEDCEKTLPAVAADAHLAAGFLDHHLGRHSAAQKHAEKALELYRALGSHSHAAYISACLAGQAAWQRPRYQDAAKHWTTASALHPAPTITSTTEPHYLDLHTALASAVLNTGDAPRARTLLEQPPTTSRTAPIGDSSVSTDADQSRQAVAYALPPLTLSDPIHPEQRTAWIRLLQAQTSFALANYEQSVAHAIRILDDPTAGPHHKAIAHWILANLALRTWTMEQAGHHLHEGVASARQCPDQRCLVYLLLARAQLAKQKAEWSPRRESPAPLPASLSLLQRRESAHQRDLAARERAAAAELATAFNSPMLQAHCIVDTEPESALALFRAVGDQLGEAHALRALSDNARSRGDLHGSDRYATQALTLYRTIGNELGEAHALRTLADSAKIRGDPDGALRHAAQALALFRAIGNQLGEAHILVRLADNAVKRGDPDGALRHAAQALALFRAIGNQLGEAHALGALSDNAGSRGDPDGSDRYATQALTLYRSIGDQLGEANVLHKLANNAVSRGDPDGSDQHATQSLTLYRSIGDQLGEAHALRTLADNAGSRGDVHGSDRYATQALTLYRTIGNKLGEAHALAVLAENAGRRGDPDGSDQHAAQSLALCRSIGHQLGEAHALRTLADNAGSRGDLHGSDRYATQALTLYRTIGHQLGEAHILVRLADNARQDGRLQEGRRQIEAAAALYETLGLPKLLEQCRKRVREW
ncbi:MULTISPECIES: tetratricopeptide repeat protein [unclassified Streptomyces]|uniref:tetratricopeptide repeat protein n=1 Tax=unclassified Streptomyces TaxID=2593676 RepID=UPI00403C2E5D